MTRHRLERNHRVAKLAVTAALLLAPPAGGAAHAASVTCDLVEPGVITADGLLDDWQSKGAKAGGNRQDSGFTVRCAYDPQHLLLAVDVRDNYLARSKRPTPGADDHLVIALSVAGTRKSELRVFPASDAAGSTRTWNGKAVPAWLTVEDSQQSRGWAVEVSIPLARLPGYGKGAPGVTASIANHDIDVSRKDKVTLDALLQHPTSASVYRSFLQATRLAAKDIRLDQVANVDGAPGPERVVAGGRIIGVLGAEFSFMELPVTAAADVLTLELTDVRGDGTLSILTELRQHGNGGSRDIVTIWQPTGTGSFERVLAFEVRKALGGKVLANRWSLVPRGTLRAPERGAKRRGGSDLLVEVSEADVTGWDEDSYNEAPATDVRPILMPWAAQTSAVYYLDGNAGLGGDPKLEPRGARKRSR